jgi:hypothetical protein
MADSSVLLSLTADTLAGWKAEKVALEREIAAKQQQLAAVNDRLKAAEILIGKADADVAAVMDNIHWTVRNAQDRKATGTTMIEAVEKMANESPRALTKAEVRDRLAKMGFPEGSLGNYFYTTVSRLKAKGRIQVRENGDLWKAPEPAFLS